MRDTLARADAVVGMASLLSQPVEQTLRRHPKRYVRKRARCGGFRNELAGLAPSGNRSAAVEGA
ncbi:MAG: hypothetical protein E6H48_10765 [Betaproteobacteria bacterium]|nr:MAG: hypothetical protein E6H48_10765 [Betaproteobacteria bacterium]